MIPGLAEPLLLAPRVCPNQSTVLRGSLMNVFRACAVGLVAFATLFLACPLRADDARIQALRQQIDNDDVQIRRIVGEISNASDQQAIQELNQQKRQWEKQRSADVFALYQAQEADRLAAQKRAQIDAAVAAFRRAVADLVSEVGRLASARESHNSDARAQAQAVAYFESLPASQQTQAEFDRLNRWGHNINTRRDNLIAWHARLKARAAQLVEWENRIARGDAAR